MIIDTHAHIGKVLNFNMKAHQIADSMERAGIDFTLVSNIEAVEYDHKGRKIPRILQKPQNKVLRKTIEILRPYSDKMGILIWMKSASEQPDAAFEAMLEENRDIIYGFKLHPFHSRVAPDEERMEPVYELARRYALPIVSHTGGCEQARSVHLFRAAQKHPELNFVMVHMDLGTDNSEAISLLPQLDNLYGDTTWVSVESTLKAIQAAGSEKLLFGTDNPIDGPETLWHNKFGERSLYQAYFHELKDSISERDYDNIMYKNAEKLFRIDLSRKKWT